MMKHCLKLAVLSVCTAMPIVADAGAFLYASESNGIDIITHPSGYTGAGGNLVIRVCIDPNSAYASNMEIPVQNNINIYNQMQPTLHNLVTGTSTNVPSGKFDFESVALHEIGHCLGLGHANAASESGLSGNAGNATRATDGSNNVFDVNDGADNIFGSSDDIRGDDVNLHWYRIANNDPFTIDTVIDQTTYARDLASLPVGHSFAASANRDVANLLGYGGDTEAIMKQGTSKGEAQRTIGHDDLATLLYGASGQDEQSNTSDDYTITLEYGGISTTNCDISMSFTSTPSLAFCGTTGTFLRPSNQQHTVVTSANIEFGDSYGWFFNPDTVNQPPALAVIGDQLVAENAIANLQLSAIDPEGDAITYSASGLPAFATLTDLNDGTATLDIAPLTADAGYYTITITVTDNGLPNVSSQETFTLTVTNNTQAPVLAPIGGQTVVEGSALNLVFTASDAENQNITYSATGTNGFINLTDQNNGTALFDVTPTLGDAGIYQVTVTVTDDGILPLSSNETFDVTVIALDSDGDGLSDYDEINLYLTDPNNTDSDGDLLDDGIEVSLGSDPNDSASWPAIADGDLAPLNNPDGLINAADLVIGQRIVLQQLTPNALQFAHGDLYPPGSPDGVIDTSDLILLQQLILQP